MKEQKSYTAFSGTCVAPFPHSHYENLRENSDMVTWSSWIEARCVDNIGTQIRQICSKRGLDCTINVEKMHVSWLERLLNGGRETTYFTISGKRVDVTQFGNLIDDFFREANAEIDNNGKTK